MGRWVLCTGSQAGRPRIHRAGRARRPPCLRGVPSAQLSTTFLSREINAGSIVFEDPAHDFPQRVGYRRVAADRMLAWIEGTVAGKTRRQEFPYRRVDCPR